MDILLMLGGLLAALIVAGWSCARSYFHKGRLTGREETIREFMNGIRVHYELDEQNAPESITTAIKAVNSAAAYRKKGKLTSDPYSAQLCILGYAVGEACWVQGHRAGVKRKAPAEGNIRVDFSLTELLQLSWLAHLGFQNMMPNYRGFEIHRFSGAEDAHQGAKAVSKIECAIPEKHRPFADITAQLKRRQKLICDWWQEVPSRMTA